MIQTYVATMALLLSLIRRSTAFSAGAQQQRRAFSATTTAQWKNKQKYHSLAHSHVIRSSSSSTTNRQRKHGILSATLRGDTSSAEQIESPSSSFDNDTYQDADDTIFALSSGMTDAQATALAVVRISGPQATNILSELSKNKPTPKPRMATLRTLSYQNQVLDQALVLYFPGPNSFTGEDIVELHLHGSRAVVKSMLAVLAQFDNTRYADRGEFTQRAYANGKLDLLQVEALADVLTSDTTQQLQLALQQLDGSTSQLYNDWRSTLTKGLAHAEAVIDFGDDEALGEDDIIPEESQQWDIWGNIIPLITDLKLSMEHQLSNANRNERIREGTPIAIVGPPNAGKSSLFNVLANQDVAIVSDIAGTTRDVLNIALDLGGAKVLLQDTAGLRDESATNDVLEVEGMKRSIATAQKSQFIVVLVDLSSVDHESEVQVETILEALKRQSSVVSSDDEDEAVEIVDQRKKILVLNKVDLFEGKSENSSSLIEKQFQGQFDAIHTISCRSQQGIDGFLESLQAMVTEHTSSSSDEDSYLITRTRHRQHVQSAAEALERFIMLAQDGAPVADLAAEELRLATSELGRVTGAVNVEDVLDVLFADFCIGK